MGRKQIIPTFEYEEELWGQGKQYVAGIDEAGRGAFAGPLVAAAVVFRPDVSFYGIRKIRDSKLTCEKDREKVFGYIKKGAQGISVGMVSSTEIDTHGVGRANILAFERALENISNVDFALIDGRSFRGFSHDFKSIIKGERKSVSIAAASIVAKVTRDRFMVEAASKHQMYEFEKHKGYGTKRHRDLIANHGICSLHRRSFLKGFDPAPTLDF